MPKVLSNTLPVMAIIKLNTMPIRKFLTLKYVSGTSQSAINMMVPLITSINKPKLKIVAGKVSKTKMGLTNLFNKDKMAANIIATQTLATSTPGSNIPEIKIASAVTRNLISC